MTVLSIAPLGLLLLAGYCHSDGGFGYDEFNGPSTWPDHWAECGGSRQSPINIDESTVTNVTIQPPFKIECSYNCRSLISRANITNNGHTAMIQLSSKEKHVPTVTGGPVGDDKYMLRQVHFHWGKDNEEGSETTFNNRSYPLEMHAVFYNLKYGTYEEAVKHPDGLLVIGYVFEIAPTKNPTMQLITKVLPKIAKVGTTTKLCRMFQIMKLLQASGSSTSSYYTYSGSLTTPPCSEIVTWVLFKTPQTLSNDQIEAFRKLLGSDGKTMTHNYRPVQPLGDREVRQHIPSNNGSGQKGNTMLLPFMALETLLGFLLATV